MDVKLLALKEAQKIRQTPVKLVGKEGNIQGEQGATDWADAVNRTNRCGCEERQVAQEEKAHQEKESCHAWHRGRCASKPSDKIYSFRGQSFVPLSAKMQSPGHSNHFFLDTTNENARLPIFRQH